MDTAPPYLLLRFGGGWNNTGTSDKVYCAAALWCQRPPAALIEQGSLYTNFGPGRFLGVNFYGRRETVASLLTPAIHRNNDAHGEFSRNASMAAAIIGATVKCSKPHVHWSIKHTIDTKPRLCTVWDVVNTQWFTKSNNGYDKQWAVGDVYSQEGNHMVSSLADLLGDDLLNAHNLNSGHMHQLYSTFTSFPHEATYVPAPPPVRQTIKTNPVKRRRVIDL